MEICEFDVETLWFVIVCRVFLFCVIRSVHGNMTSLPFAYRMRIDFHASDVDALAMERCQAPQVNDKASGGKTKDKENSFSALRAQ